MYSLVENKIIFTDNIQAIKTKALLNDIKKLSKLNDASLDLSGLEKINSITISFLKNAQEKYNLNIIYPEKIKSRFIDFEKSVSYDEKEKQKYSSFENFVLKVNYSFASLSSFVVLAADSFYYALRALFTKKGRRPGSVYEQILLMGNNAIGIVALISLLIGFILSLQSAAQLKQFGANIYLVDLIVVSMISEMGPIITAIIVAGRSGSAIAAEIATMKITEELDALKVMALNPLKYVVAPKLIAMTLSLPLLTILANLIGIFGGFLIAVFYLDLNQQIFFERALSVMSVRMWRICIVKSLIFSWLITLIGVFCGFSAKGGADGVGKVTTSSVVLSIFAVITADALLSIVFYFKF
ncbi:MAG: ABC transporter permease [Pseudomonadota bacterium]